MAEEQKRMFFLTKLHNITNLSLADYKLEYNFSKLGS